MTGLVVWEIEKGSSEAFEVIRGWKYVYCACSTNEAFLMHRE
jgi:hypothetical protein